MQSVSLGGRSLALADGLIGATVLKHNLTLVTRNTKNFIGLGVSILNPWEPQDVSAVGHP